MIKETSHQDNSMKRVVNSCQLNIASLAQDKALAFMTSDYCTATIVDQCKLHDTKPSIMLDV